MSSRARAEVVQVLAARLVASQAALRPQHPLRVAVDGITAAGKSTLAGELTATLEQLGHTAIHLSTDDYHHVAAVRHRGADRANGYYRDAYDLVAFRRLVLDPLGPGGDRRYVARHHDLVTDELLSPTPKSAPRDAVVVVDGSFLQSAALAGGWDEVIWLDVPFARAADRAAGRDAEQFGGEEATRAVYAQRYHAACRLYLDEVRPRESASIVVDDADLAAPRLVRI